MHVYLAGPISGVTLEEAVAWREKVTVTLSNYGIKVLNPLRDRYVKENGNYHLLDTFTDDEVFHRNLADVYNCDFLLAYMPEPSIGTLIEIIYAWLDKTQSRVIYLVSTNARVAANLFLKRHITKTFATIDQAVAQILVDVAGCPKG